MTGRRVTAANADRRNRHLLDMAESVLLLYASPGGETERVARRAVLAEARLDRADFKQANLDGATTNPA